MGVKLLYRMKKSGEEALLLELWDRYGGWGAVNQELWKALMLDGSRGEAPVVVAVNPDNERIEGQMAFLPAMLQVNGRPIDALRPFAAILSPVARQDRALGHLDHPMINMYRYGIEQLRSQGFRVVYMLPNPGFLPLLRLFPHIRCGRFPLWRIPLPLERPLSMPVGFDAIDIINWDDVRIEALQEQNAASYRCMVWRKPRDLERRCRAFHLRAIGVEREGNLVGLALHRAHLVADLVVTDAGDSLRAVLTTVVNAGHRASCEAPEDRPISGLGIVAVQRFLPMLQDLGFVYADYDYTLMVDVLDPTVDDRETEPANWYVTQYD